MCHMTNPAPGPAVAIIGAGAMGSGIAQVAAQAGSPVHLVDAVPGAAAAARERVAATLDRLAGKGRISRDDAAAATTRLTVTGSVSDLPPCALVIEAIREDLADKRALFTELAHRQPAGTLLASNTSSLDISAIADGIAHPERVLGLHFFNPPPLMRLVEVVHGAQTSGEVLVRATELVRAWGKTPVRCTSTPGFIVNRVARPFYGEAQRMVEAGVADPATIDFALRELAGFKMGPMELTDLIGQDVNLAVGTSVWEQTGRDERYAPTDFQRRLVREGHLGRKTGRGVFVYDDSGRPQGVAPDEQLARQLVAGPVATNPVARTLAMLVNEAVDLVARGEASAEDVDTAMRLGTNYPRGPIEWGAGIGLDVVAAQLTELDAAFPGGRYRPSPALTAAGVQPSTGVRA
jgi:3-hydroxybutyryl-CoA dehydrogenase